VRRVGEQGESVGGAGELLRVAPWVGSRQLWRTWNWSRLIHGFAEIQGNLSTRRRCSTGCSDILWLQKLMARGTGGGSRPMPSRGTTLYGTPSVQLAVRLYKEDPSLAAHARARPELFMAIHIHIRLPLKASRDTDTPTLSV
jgi:hypothetical protein